MYADAAPPMSAKRAPIIHSVTSSSSSSKPGAGSVKLDIGNPVVCGSVGGKRVFWYAYARCPNGKDQKSTSLFRANQRVDAPHPSPCCARAALGHLAARAMTVKNWRRLKSSRGSFPDPAVPA